VVGKTWAALRASRSQRYIRNPRPDRVSSARRNFRVNGPVSGFVVAASLPRSGAAECYADGPLADVSARCTRVLL
jgi:hypothetical protein